MIVTYDSRIVIWGIFKTCICCAWDSNPEQQDSRCRRIHWAIAAAPWETNLEMFQFYWPQLFIQRRERVGLREKSSHSFSVHFGPMLDARSIKLNETFSLLESNSNDNKWKLIKNKLNDVRYHFSFYLFGNDNGFIGPRIRLATWRSLVRTTYPLKLYMKTYPQTVWTCGSL